MQANDWIGRHSVLAPVGPEAERIHGLWTFMWIVCAVLFVIVLGTLLLSLNRRATGDTRRATLVVSGCVAATAVILGVFLTYNFSVAHVLTDTPRGALEIRIVGHQWWWEVIYPSGVPQNQVTTANEMVVPVGQPILTRLESADVIHSFWPPNLMGKRDLIPRETNERIFTADTAGVYRSQCAEFCGYQHAKMTLLVVAVSPDSFVRWLDHARSAANEPSDSLASRGKELFLTSACVMCHTIGGTIAGSRTGPVLTHFGSRASIAAGTMANTRANLESWIVDPQRHKPGTLMPGATISRADVAAIAAYLESLK